MTKPRVMYQPRHPFEVQTGTPEEIAAGHGVPQAVRSHIDWQFHSRFDTLAVAIMQADVLAKNHPHVRVIQREETE